MKKILLFITLLFIPIFVNAELKGLELVDQYNTGYSETYYMGDYLFLVKEVYKSEDSYHLLAAMDLDGNFIYQIPKEGRVNKTIFDNEYLYYLYTEDVSNNNYKLHIEKYNPKNGEMIKELVIEDMRTSIHYYKAYKKDGQIELYALDPTYKSYRINKDLTEYNEVTLDHSTTIETYTEPDIEYISDDEQEAFDSFLKNNNISSMNTYRKAVSFNNQYYTFTTRFLNNVKPNIIYADKDLTDYDLIPIQNDKLYDGSKFISESVSGEDSLNVLALIPHEDRLIAILKYSVSCLIAYDPSERFGGNCADDTYVQVYKPQFTITTQTDGNGQIKVSKENARSKDEVTFEIIPKEGYVLSEVKVTDSEGNTVTFTSNKFTMPSSDVLIEAKFVKSASVPANPDTKDEILIMVIILFISALSILLIKEKEKERKLT